MRRPNLTVDDRTRMELHRRLTEVLGDQEADTLMAHLPPVTWQNVATTDSVDSARLVLTTQIDALRSDVERNLIELRSDLQTQINELRSDTERQFTELRSDLQTQINELRSDTERQFTDVRADLNGHVVALHAALSTGLAELREDMHRAARSIVVLFASLTAAATTLGALFA